MFGTHPPILDRIAMAEAFRARSGRRSRGGSDPLRGRVARPRVLHRVDQLAGELRRHVDPRNDDSGNVALLDLVVDACEGDRELVGREADVREVRVDAGEVLRVDVDVELPLAAVVVHAAILLRMSANAVERLASELG